MQYKDSLREEINFALLQETYEGENNRFPGFQQCSRGFCL